MYVTCPDPACRVPAEILDRITLGSTGGPMEHVRTYCVRRHVFALPVERVPGATWRDHLPDVRARHEQGGGKPGAGQFWT